MYKLAVVVVHDWTQMIVVKSIKDDKTEENTFKILQHSDRNINNS